MLNLPSVQKNVSRAAPNGNPDKAPRPARKELAGHIWPASRRLPTSVLDGHALIEALGKPHGCQTFGDYIDAFIQTITSHFGERTTRVDVVFDRYFGEGSIKVVTRSKQVDKKPIHKLIDGPHGPLLRV